MKKNSKKKFVASKRTIKAFIKDEDGFVTKDNILKIGLGTVASVGIMGAFSKAYGHSHIYFANPNTLWVRTNMGNLHQNSLGLSAIPGNPNCQRMTHANGNQHLNHVSTDVNGFGTGCLHTKGCAPFDYNGAANGTPPNNY